MRMVVRGFGPLLAWAAFVLLAAGSFSAGQPPAGGPSKEQQKAIYESLRDVTNKGADLFNKQGDVAGCYRLYEGALIAVAPLVSGDAELKSAVDAALGQAQGAPSVVQKAFIIRKALDAIRDKYNPNPKVQPPPDGEKEKSFGLVFSGVVKLKQGEKKTFVVGVNRGKEFTANIDVTAKGSPGIKIEPEKQTVDASKNAFQLSVTAAKDAPVGKGKVEVNGAGGGKEAKMTITIEVEKGAGPPPEAKFIFGAAKDLKVKQGEKTEVTIPVTATGVAGKFTVEWKAPKGLTITPPKTEVATDAAPTTNLKVTITAAKDAPPGKAEFEGTATSGTAKGSAKFSIDVLPAGGEPPPPKSEVSGKVTVDGKAVAGIIHFFGADGKGHKVNFGGADGAYKIGLAPGAYKVAVTPDPKIPPTEKSPIPAEYFKTETSGLTIQAKPGNQIFDVKMVSDKGGKNPPDKNPPPPPVVKAAVSGSVMLDGKPLHGATVHFIGADGKDHASAATTPNGFYSVAETGTIGKDGVFKAEPFGAGDYKVTVTAPKTPVPGFPKISVPAKYEDAKSSGLTCTVKPGLQQFNIDLKSDKGAPPPAEQKGDKDLEALQGTWNVDSQEWGGKALPKELMKGYKFVFEGNKLTWDAAVGLMSKMGVITPIDGHFPCEFKIDSGKELRQIDITLHLKKGDATVLGIYEIKGDTLKICYFTSKTGKRPTEFGTGDNLNIGSVTLTKAKK